MAHAKLERKLRKRARRLARFARRNGLDHVSMFVFAPDDARTDLWYADAVAHVGDEQTASTSDYYAEEEL